LSRREAIHKAAGIRLRPILMTTAAMVVGMVPLLTASGAGAASRFAIGMVIAAGMTIGTLFTLFVTPAVYTYLARDHQAAKRKLEAETAGIGAGQRPEDLDAEAADGAPFPAEPEPAPEADAASPGKDRGLPTAAE
ncbi:MAG: efflux RND transporter permease subunit, partial [Methyloceanibacter sp.]